MNLEMMAGAKKGYAVIKKLLPKQILFIAVIEENPAS